MGTGKGWLRVTLSAPVNACEGGSCAHSGTIYYSPDGMEVLSRYYYQNHFRVCRANKAKEVCDEYDSKANVLTHNWLTAEQLACYTGVANYASLTGCREYAESDMADGFVEHRSTDGELEHITLTPTLKATATARMRRCTIDVEAGTDRVRQVEFVYTAMIDDMPDTVMTYTIERDVDPPTDIFALGVPRDVQVNDLAPTSEVRDRLRNLSRLAATPLPRHVCVNLAETTDATGQPNGKYREIGLRLDDGDRWAVYRYVVETDREEPTANPAHALPLPSNWPEISHDRVLTLVRDAKPFDVLIATSDRAWCGRYDDTELKWVPSHRPSNGMAVTGRRSMKFIDEQRKRTMLNDVIWRTVWMQGSANSRYELLRQPDASALTGLRHVFPFFNRDGERGRDITTHLWFDSNHGEVCTHLVYDGMGCNSKPSGFESRSYELKELSDGVWYPTRTSTIYSENGEATWGRRTFFEAVQVTAIDDVWFTDPVARLGLPV